MAMRVVGALLISLLCIGCNGSGEEADEAVAQSPGHVDGPLLVSHGTSRDGLMAGIAGVPVLRHGCLYLASRWTRDLHYRLPVVWPEGTVWHEDTQTIELPQGDLIGLNDDRVAGGGGYFQVSAVRSGAGDEVADAASACVGRTGEVAFFNRGFDVIVHPKD